MSFRSFAATALALCGLFMSVPASAHFKLLKPASWLKEDSTGGPQKGSPCGPGNSGFLGDDVQPVPTSGMVSEFHAGEMIEISLEETVPHPGYFRVALAKDRSELTIPPVDNPMSCALNLDAVPTGAHDNILADGLWKEPNQPAARQLKTTVKLPDQPCEKCTLQVVQVMKDHGLNSCYYYHCADIKILPGAGTGTAGASAAGSGGSAGAATNAGSGGSSAAGNAAVAGAGGAAGSTATPSAGAMAAAGTSGAAGRASSAAGSVAAPSGSAGVTPGAAGAAGQGTTTSSPAGAAGAITAAAGTPAAPAAKGSGGCAVSPARSSRSAGMRGSLVLLAVAGLVRVSRRRRTKPASRTHA